MAVREIAPGIFGIGVQDWDRRLFDSLISLPGGTSYNSYLVRGNEKTALIDTVDPSKEMEFITNLVKLGVDTIDFVVVNHAEQDHSGTLPMVAELFPHAKLVMSEKCRDFVGHLLEISPDRCMVVSDKATLSLGDKTLEFIMAPWVHWPETMLTYLRQDRILFPCDLFGAHLATSDLFVKNPQDIYQPAKRYYAEIMMPFRAPIKGHLKRLAELDIDIIAPSHGPLHKNPDFILDCYRGWVSDEVKNEVVIPYVSMHGSTEKMVHHLCSALIEKGVGVKPFNMTQTDLGDLAMALVDAATIVVGTPTMLFGPHPTIMNVAYIINLLKPKARHVGIIGSFGWGGNTTDVIKAMLPNLKAEMLDPIYIKGTPGADCYRDLDRFAALIAQKHNASGIS